jgi:hypothetical protein
MRDLHVGRRIEVTGKVSLVRFTVHVADDSGTIQVPASAQTYYRTRYDRGPQRTSHVSDDLAPKNVFLLYS